MDGTGDPEASQTDSKSTSDSGSETLTEKTETSDKPKRLLTAREVSSAVCWNGLRNAMRKLGINHQKSVATSDGSISELVPSTCPAASKKHPIQGCWLRPEQNSKGLNPYDMVIAIDCENGGARGNGCVITVGRVLNNLAPRRFIWILRYLQQDWRSGKSS